jgi:hypothetical protein
MPLYEFRCEGMFAIFESYTRLSREKARPVPAGRHGEDRRPDQRRREGSGREFGVRRGSAVHRSADRQDPAVAGRERARAQPLECTWGREKTLEYLR